MKDSLVWSVVVMFISYEGAFTASDGAASGMTSVDMGDTLDWPSLTMVPGTTPLDMLVLVLHKQ